MPSPLPCKQAAIATLLEAFAFTAVVLIDIWFLHSRTWWGDALPGGFAVVSFAAHREFPVLGIRELAEALRAWRIVLLIGTIAVIGGLLFKSHPLNLLFRGAVYFAWCVVQQLLLQNMIYRRIRSTLGATMKAALLSGVLFAAAHVPNPVLVPATLVWGTIAARLFERHPSIIAIALLQTLFSSLLIWLTPVAWNHQFRVGPGYWQYR
jgi:hypothetical protein